METQKIIAGIVAGGTLVMGGVDASVLNETAIQRVEAVAHEQVEAKQIGNVVETTLPWKGENGLKVKYDMGEPTAAEMIKDKRDKEVVTDLVDFGDGGFKVDILLNKKPDTNVFCYTIEGAENYDFEYQPPLNEEIRPAKGEVVTATQHLDVDGNVRKERAEEIVGSYAVYHKELQNHITGQENYATGKVMHIPKPQVWEVNNKASTTQWAELSFDEKTNKLCVTASQDFLDNATYPVRIDPTFGYTSAGASSINAQSSYTDRGAMRGAGLSGDVSDINGYFFCQSAGVNACRWHLSLVNETSSAPGGTAHINGSITSMTGTSAQLKTVSASYTMTGANVWIIGTPFYNGTGGRLAYDSAGGTVGENAYSPDYGGWSTSNSWRVSVYATYTESGGGGGGGEETKQDSDFWFE